RLLQRPEAVQRGHRAEYLLAGEELVVADVLEYRRRDQVRLRIGPLASRDQLSVLLAATLDPGHHVLELVLVDDRADLCVRIGGIADAARVDPLKQPAAEL